MFLKQSRGRKKAKRKEGRRVAQINFQRTAKLMISLRKTSRRRAILKIIPTLVSHNEGDNLHCLQTVFIRFPFFFISSLVLTTVSWPYFRDRDITVADFSYLSFIPQMIGFASLRYGWLLCKGGPWSSLPRLPHLFFFDKERVYALYSRGLRFSISCLSTLRHKSERSVSIARHRM